MTKLSHLGSLPHLTGRPFPAGSGTHCPSKRSHWKFYLWAFHEVQKHPNRSSTEGDMTFRSWRSCVVNFDELTTVGRPLFTVDDHCSWTTPVGRPLFDDHCSWTTTVHGRPLLDDHCLTTTVHGRPLLDDHYSWTTLVRGPLFDDHCSWTTPVGRPLFDDHCSWMAPIGRPLFDDHCSWTTLRPFDRL